MIFEDAFRHLLADTVRTVVREELAQLSQAGGRLVTIDHAASLVDVSKKTVRRWVDSGELASHGEGRLTRVDADEVKACLARQKAPRGKTESVEERTEHILSTLPGRRSR